MSDRRGGALVAVVNQALARALWPGGNPIGARIRTAYEPGRTFTVIGVAGNVTTPGFTRPPPPEVFVDDLQIGGNGVPLYLRSHAPWPEVKDRIRGLPYRLDPTAFLGPSRSLPVVWSSALAVPRLRAGAVAIAAVLALLLAVSGAAGYAALLAASRQRELAIRAALGATPRQLARHFGTSLAAWIGLGLGIGLAFLFVLADFIRQMLFSIGPLDPWLLLAAAAALTAAIAIAAWPAMRGASRQEPAALLRSP